MPEREEIIQKIKALTSSKHPDAEVYLYGSQAKGNYTELSDWDLLVLLNESQISFPLEIQIMDEFYELELETGAIFSPMIYSKSEWKDKYSKTPLFENIEKDGIRLK